MTPASASSLKPADRHGPGFSRLKWGSWFDRHERVLHVIVVLAAFWGFAYIAWRALYSFDGANLFFGLALLGTEVFGWSSLLLFAWFSWTRNASETPIPTTAKNLSVGVVICTYNEPEEVLRATLTGVADLDYPHSTYVLDDGRREWVRDLSEEFGALWVTRPDNSHAKAGNINHALKHALRDDLLLILDADHIPVSYALDSMVGYFNDPKMALVQSPHDFFNHDSVQHYGPGRHDQSTFFEVIMPGKNRHGGAFWCGSASLIRREALDDVGGVAVETIAEDFHTTIKMHSRGWRSVYHNEVLVQGLGPLDLPGYLIQRDRWCRGNIAVTRTPQAPWRAKNLTLSQRLSHYYTLRAYVAGPVRLLQLFFVVISFLTAWMPMRIAPFELAVLWVPWMILSTSAGVALSRGFMGEREAAHYELLTAEIHTKAIVGALLGSKKKFKVTPKRAEGPTGGARDLLLLKWLLFAAFSLLGVLVTRLVDLGLRLSGHSGFLPHLATPAFVVLGALSIFELVYLVRTFRRVSQRRQRRADYRFTLPAVDAQISGQQAYLTDLSTGGAAFTTALKPSNGDVLSLSTRLPVSKTATEVFTSDVVVRNVRPVGDQGAWQVGVSFSEMTPSSKRVLYKACFLVGALGTLEETRRRREQEESKVVRRQKGRHVSVVHMRHKFTSSRPRHRTPSRFQLALEDRRQALTVTPRHCTAPRSLPSRAAKKLHLTPPDEMLLDLARSRRPQGLVRF